MTAFRAAPPLPTISGEDLTRKAIIPLRIAVLSDLHLDHTGWEPSGPLDADILVAAGDYFDDPLKGLDWLAERFHLPTIFVPGNHDFYGWSYEDARHAMRERAQARGITLLDRSTHEVTDNGGAIRFIGCTLWTDYAILAGEGLGVEDAKLEARARVNDYSRVQYQGAPLTPEDVEVLYQDERAWLIGELARPFDGKTVVVTHFAPHIISLNPKYEKTPFAPYFVSDLSQVIEEYAPALWIHGHTHFSCDYSQGKTRIVSNQTGKRGASATNPFKEQCVVRL